MPDYSDPTANFPTSAPRTLPYDESHDADADGTYTDRDSATPQNVAGAHLKALANEVIAISGWTDTNRVSGLYVTDNGGIQVAYTAGRLWTGSGAPVDISASTLNLSDDATNYVEVSPTGTVSKNTTSFTSGALPLATVICAAADISSVTDDRTTFYVSGSTVFAGATELTISGGVVTMTQTAHTIDTEADAPSDNLDTINGGSNGFLLMIRAEHTDRTVVLKHGTGNLALNGTDITLDDNTHWVMLCYDGTLSKWGLVGSASGGVGDMTKAVYDADGDGLITASAGGTELDTSASTGVPLVTAGTWSVPAQVSLARGGTGQDFSVTPIGSVIAFNVANTASIVTGAVDGHVLTVQADGTLAFEAVSGAGDMLKATYDADADGDIDPSAGGTGINTSADTGFPSIAGGTWSVIKHNLAAVTSPGINDDSISGYAVSSTWINLTLDKAFVCLDATAGAAVWTETTAAVSAHTFDSATHSDVAAITEAQGQVLYFDGANWNALAPGSSGDFLQTRGAGQDPVWASGAGQNKHNFDSATHLDVQNMTESRGMTIFRNASNKWDGLAAGTSGQLLQTRSTTNDPQWVWGVLADGTIALTGNWDAGSFQIRAETFQSDVATGTAPLTVASTTVVSNLNASAVGGKAETAFVLVDGSRALTAAWDAGSYEIRAETFQSDVATGTAPLVVASTTVVANLNAASVGGKAGADIVTGPASSTDNAIARFDSTTGKLLQNSGATVDDNGDLTCDKATFNETACFDAEFDNGNSGVADTIDWGVGNKQKSTLTGNCTYTFTAPAGPCNLILRLIQDATGSRLVTWPATVKWPAATAPTLTTTAAGVDIVAFYYNGTNYYGTSALAFG